MFVAALAWAAVFCFGGALAMVAFVLLAFHHGLPPQSKGDITGLGAACGLSLFALGFCFARLPGARRPPGAPHPFGVVQGIWGMAGFGVVQASGSGLVASLLVLADFVLLAQHAKAHVDFNGHVALLALALAAEAACAAWMLWYLRYLGQNRVRDGSVTGIGWRPAPAAGYVAALISAAVILLIVTALFHVDPPKVKNLQGLPMMQLANGPPWTLVPLGIVVVFVGPVLEEFAFRGIAFAGLATRLGPLWSGVITTIVFTLAHAPEKLHYVPGFIDVMLFAAVAAVLRVRYRSIRPGMLLHVVYNAGVLVAAGAG